MKIPSVRAMGWMASRISASLASAPLLRFLDDANHLESVCRIADGHDLCNRVRLHRLRNSSPAFSALMTGADRSRLRSMNPQKITFDEPYFLQLAKPLKMRGGSAPPPLATPRDPGNAIRAAPRFQSPSSSHLPRNTREG